MPAKPPTDLSKMVIDTQERVDALEKRSDLEHERINILEKHAGNMSGLPATVAAMGQRLVDLDKSMIREVDGLREQQKAHKVEAAEKMEKGFQEISVKVDGVVERVGRMTLQNARQTGWWDVLQVVGGCLVGIALILEAYKSLMH